MTAPRARFPALLLTALALAAPARAADVEDRAVSLATAAVRQHRLLTPVAFLCSDFVFTGVEAGIASVTVAERHGGRCGGDPAVAPARFHMDIDLASGAITWDDNDDREMRPLR